MIRYTLPLLVLSLTFLPSGPGLAGIVTTSSNVKVGSPPPNFREGEAEDDSNVLLFAEQSRFPLPANLPLNLTATGIYPVGTDPHFTPGLIASGSFVDTYILHFDPLGRPSNSNAVFIEGSVTFGREILGLITKSVTLNATNEIVALPGIIYPANDFQGIELGQPGTYLELSSDRRTVNFGFPVGPHADNLRIATIAVPETNSILLCSLSVLGAFATARHRKPSGR